MDDGAPVLEVGFAIGTGGSFDELQRLSTLFDSAEVKAVRNAKSIEQATSGMVNVAGATAAISSFGNAYSRAEQIATREAAKIEKAGERLIAQLERQNAAYGKTREELRGLKAQELALSLERTNNTDAAARLRAQEQALFAQEYATARQASAAAKALAEDRATAAAEAAAAAGREAQAVREAAQAYQMFEAAARRGVAVMREQAATAAAQAAETEARAVREAAQAHQMFEAAARRGVATMREQQAAEAAATIETEALAAAGLRLRASIDPAFAAQQRFDREMGQAQQLIRSNAITLDDYSAKLRMEQSILDETSAAHGRGASSAGAHRAAMQGLSFQAQDTFTQISMGANPLSVLAIQGGQAAGQMVGLENKLGTVAKFMIGPWGLAITAGLLVLGALTKGLFDNGEASKAAEEGLKKFKDRQGDIGNFIDETTGKLIEQNRTLVLNATLTRQKQIDANKETIAGQGKSALDLAQRQATTAIVFTNAQGDKRFGLDPDVQRAIASARGDVDKLAVSIANLASTRRPDLKGLALDISNQAGQAILAQRENAKLALELRALGGDTSALAQGTTSLIEKQVALATAATPLARARAQLALVQQGAAAADKAGGAALVRYRDDLTAATGAVQAAEAAQKAATEAKRDAARADRADDRQATARADFEAQTAGLREQVALIRAGVEATEAKFRVEQALAGMTQAAIEARIAAEERLNVELDARKDFAKHMADTDLLPGMKDTAAITVKAFTSETEKANAAFAKFIETTDKLDLDGVFGRASKGLASMASAFDELIDHQDTYKKLRAAAGKDADRLAQLDRAYRRDQISDYANVTGAAKQFFKQGSAGYKTLHAAELAFRSVELAMAIKNAAVKLGLLGTETVAKVGADAAMAASDTARAGVEQGNSLASAATKGVEAVVNAIRSLPFPANLAAGAATAAAVAALGISIAGGFGGGHASLPTTNEGKGTVLGDSDAKSESIARSLDQLRDIDAGMLRYSSQMARSLQNIEQQLGGVASLIVRGGGLDGVTAGIQTGGASGILGKLFGSKTSIVGNGIYAGAQSLGDILSGGFDASYYADIQKTKKTLGFTTSKKFSTTMTGADDELESQFGAVLRQFYDAIGAAAGPLGKSLDDIESNLTGFVVDLGRIDLKGLTGEEIQEKLSAVFGAAGDRMAQAALGGLERFQHVGEGYLETIVRVSSSVEAMADRFRLLGSAAGLGVDATMSLVEAFGDIAGALSATDDYFGSFYTDAERTAARTAQLQGVIESLGMAMPGSVAAFRALVDAQDLTTDAGQAAYVSLLKLAPAFSDVFGSAQDAADAATSAAQDAAEAARDAADAEAQRLAGIANERLGLERQLLDLLGDTAELRRRELAGLDESNRALQERIYGIQDQQAAQKAADAAAQETAKAAEAAASDAARALQDAADAAKRAADEQAAALAAIANERQGLVRQLLQEQGDTAALRAMELADLDASNRALQEQIYGLQDQKVALDTQTAAQAEATRAAEQLRDAWTSIADNLLDAAKRIRGEAAGGAGGYAALLAQFNGATDAARAGDRDAAGSLTGLSDSLLKAAADQATSQQELSRIQGMIAGSLESTAAMVGGGSATLSGLSATATLASASSSQPAWWQSFVDGQVAGTQSAANDSATVTELRQLRAEVAALREDTRTGDAAIASAAGRTANALERAQPTGDAFAVMTLDGDKLATKEAA